MYDEITIEELYIINEERKKRQIKRESGALGMYKNFSLRKIAKFKNILGYV